MARSVLGCLVINIIFAAKREIYLKGSLREPRTNEERVQTYSL